MHHRCAALCLSVFYSSPEEATMLWAYSQCGEPPTAVQPAPPLCHHPNHHLLTACAGEGMLALEAEGAAETYIPLASVRLGGRGGSVIGTSVCCMRGCCSNPNPHTPTHPCRPTQPPLPP